MAKPKRHNTSYRSGLEDKVDALLTKAGIAHTYETQVFRYVKPESNHRYTPDFPLDATTIVLETKGRWDASDRKKMKLIIEQHPETTFVMLFGRSWNTITKNSKTTYGEYCDSIGLRWMCFKEFQLDPKACLSATLKNSSHGKSLTPPPKKSRASPKSGSK